MATTVQDNFNRGDGGLGSNWTVVNGTMGIVSNQARGTGAGNSAAVYNADTADTGVQSAKITRQDIYVGAICRSNGSGNCGYLCFVYSATVLRIYKINSDFSLTQLGSDISCSTSNGGKVEIRADGSTLTAWYNGVQQDTSRTDSSYGDTYLNLGIAAYATNDMDDFIAGDFLASVTVSPTAIFAIASKVDPTVIAGGGNIVVTPTPISAIAGNANPSIRLGSITLSKIIEAVTSRNNPSVRLGSLVISRTIEAIANRNNPTVRLGSLILSDTIEAVTGKADPVIRFGSLTLTDVIEAVTGRNNPSVRLGSIAITDIIEVVTGKNDPSVRLGSLSLSGIATAIAATVDPTIPGFGIIVTPAAISAVTGKADPAVRLGSLTISAIIHAVTGKADPTVRLGSLVLTDIIEAVTGRLNPSVQLSSLIITPAAIYAITSKVDPTVQAGAISYFIELVELDSDIETLIELDSEIAEPVSLVPENFVLDVGTPVFYEMPAFDLNSDWIIEQDIYLKTQGIGDQVVPFGFGNYDDANNHSYLFFEFTDHPVYGRRIDIQFSTFQQTEQLIQGVTGSWNENEWHHILMKREGNRITVRVTKADESYVEIYADLPAGETFQDINSYTLPCYRSLYYWGDEYEYDYCMPGTKYKNLSGVWGFGACYEDLDLTDPAEIDDKILSMKNSGSAGGSMRVGYDDSMYAANLDSFDNVPYTLIELDSDIETLIELDSELE